jgi:hypothetical protein
MVTRIWLMTADFFNCLEDGLFSCFEDDGNCYSETVTAAISSCRLPLPLQLFSLRFIASGFCPLAFWVISSFSFFSNRLRSFRA